MNPWPSASFYGAAIGSTGCYQCALTTNTVTGPTCTNASCMAGCQANPNLTNDIFGCGNTGVAVSAGTCDVDQSGNDGCAALDNGWTCGVPKGTASTTESVKAAHDPTASGAATGGVLCCRDM